MFKRVKYWERMLNDAVGSRAGMPFIWGQNDCITFATYCLEAITGKDWMKALEIPAYSSKEEALAIIAERGHKDLTGFVDEHAERKPINKVMRGNLVAMKTDEGVAIGIWTSPHATFVGDKGLQRVRRSMLMAAWET